MSIQFMTLNIWMGKLMNSALTFIREIEPDIMTMQEVFEGAMIDHIRAVGYPYVSFAPTHVIDGEKRGNAIFSKYPFDKVGPTVFFDVPYSDDFRETPDNYAFVPRNIHSVRINVNGKLLNIFNVHGIWGTDGEDSERRLQMGQTIVEQIKGQKNVMLAGDFNLKPTTKTVANIENYLKNVFGSKLNSTFNMKRKDPAGNWATTVVDMVFVSPDIQVLEHSCPPVDVSDHLPLVCEVEV